MRVRVVHTTNKKGNPSVAVIYPASKSKRPGETEKQWLDRVFAKTMQSDPNLKGKPFDDIDHTALPVDRKYRNAWKGPKGQPITVDAVRKADVDSGGEGL